MSDIKGTSKNSKPQNTKGGKKKSKKTKPKAPPEEPTPEPQPEPPAPPVDPAVAQAAFNELVRERGRLFYSHMIEQFEKEGVTRAFCIAWDPKTQAPCIYSNGSTYQVTSILVDMAKYYKEKLNKELKI